MFYACRWRHAAAATTAVLLAAPALHGQQFPALGGVEVRGGGVSAQDASAGPSFSVDLDLGSMGVGSLRTLLGGHYFTADLDRAANGEEASFSALGGRFGVRLDLFPRQRFTPYGSAALTGHRVTADANDARVQELLEGFYVGGQLGAGAAYTLGEDGRLAITVEGRRNFISNIGHWAFEAGIRLLTRGSAAYERSGRAVAAQRIDLAAAEREREAAREERERAEAERRRVEAERARIEAETARAEVERRQAVTEAEETARAETQAEVAAEARRRAEAEAEEARMRAEAAEEAARAAETRASAAEAQLYDALVELDRLMGELTEIRETDRGVVLVLGQGLFASGQAALSPAARDEVARIASVLGRYPDHPIVVEGHTDAVGSEVTNQRLSEQRAEAVRAALIANGVQPTRVTATGYGQSRPVAANETSEGRARNRRVEILVVGARRPGAALP